MEISQLTTEQQNPNSLAIDTLSSLEIVQVMNAEDRRCSEAVRDVSESIAVAIDAIAKRMREGGRLIYIGAGTSGRLGVLDASECPPTFNSSPNDVIGIIAGGSKALTTAIEGAEDNEDAAVHDLREKDLSARDVLVGIAASGRTPYVLAGLDFARQIGTYTIGVTCNAGSKLEEHAELVIAPVVGPEIVSGSTRLKSGTATKMVLNMLTTGAMIKLGKTYGNWMVDLRATNEKLKHRSIRMVSILGEIDLEEAERILVQSGGEVKVAIVAGKRSTTPEQSRQLLRDAQGSLRRALTDPLPSND